jgi:peptide/nickel transport system permease protein
MRELIGRLGRAVVTVLVTSVVVFSLARLSGSPADVMLPVDASPQERQALIRRMGLDKPILVQYGVYVRNAVVGDFGLSLRTRRPVAELVKSRLSNSIILATASIGVTLLVSVPLGVLAAVYRGRVWDRIAMSVALVGQSVPSFLSGILAILIFSLALRWLPTGGIGGWEYYVLPAATIGWFTSAGVVRLLRSSMLEVLDSEYVKYARAKGLRETVVIGKHALRNALIPVITFVGFMYGVILAASVATEVVFNFPGLGRLVYEATLWRDFPLLQFTVLTWTLLVVLVNICVDVIYVVLDPRIRV